MQSLHVHDVTNVRRIESHVNPKGDGLRGWVTIAVSTTPLWDEEIVTVSETTYYPKDVRSFTEDLIAKLQESLRYV